SPTAAARKIAAATIPASVAMRAKPSSHCLAEPTEAQPILDARAFCLSHNVTPDSLLRISRDNDIWLIAYVPDNVPTPLIAGGRSGRLEI
ncbi:MAG: hypothetical protein J2P55_12820, partial [Rhizobiales bacterium]|nr:hypothetical protein [Hyphomicrobiales bacterium]